MSKFFGDVTKILGIPHRSSGALAPRSNGLSEMAIKRVAEFLRKYSTDDIDDGHIEVILLIIQMSLLATSAANTKISPFEVVHGFPMPLPNPVVKEQPTFLSKNADAYCAWLKNALQLLHTAVRENRIKAKMEMKCAYDSRHGAKTLTFVVGELVTR